MTTLRIARRDARAHVADHPLRFVAGCSVALLGAGLWCVQTVSRVF